MLVSIGSVDLSQGGLVVHDFIDQAAYMAHGYCLLWKPWLVSLHAGSDLIIALAYFAIPFAIWRFLGQRRDLDFKMLAWLFAAFIFCCGVTHMTSVVTLWAPIYETQGVVKAITASVSVATALLIFPLVPKAVALPSPKQLRLVNDGLAAEIAAHRNTLVELERSRAELAVRVAARTAELQLATERFEALVLASAQVVWSMRANGGPVNDSPSWRQFTGQSLEQWRDNGWVDAVHPEDRDLALAAWQRAIATGDKYEAVYRLNHIELGWRWTHAQAVTLRDDQNEVREWVGMNTDITERKTAEEHTQFVLQELAHQTKNLLAVIGAMARQTARGKTTVDAYADELSQRLQGMARAHDLLVQQNWAGAPLREQINSQLELFVATAGRQVHVDGPNVILTPAATQCLALAFHELATNASKYGGLKRPSGRISVEWALRGRGDDVVLHLEWREACDEEIAEPSREGFGYSVIKRMVADGLEAKVELLFEPKGVVWKVTASARFTITKTQP